MAEIELDGIDASYFERLIAEEPMYRQITSDRRRDVDAQRTFLGRALSLYLRDDTFTVSPQRITLATGDHLSRDALIRLMAASITYGGRRYGFSSMVAAAEHGHFDYGSTETTEYWIEITFEPVP